MFNLDNVIKKIQKIRIFLSYTINNNREAVRFLSLFLSFSIVFFMLYFFLQDHLQFILLATATLTSFVSNLLGLSVTVQETIISIGTMNFEIIHECTGIFAIMITSSSILAYPTDPKKKTVGILFIIPFILLLNLIRLLILIYIGKFHIEFFDIVHSYLWQGTFIIFIILAWFLWIELVVNK